MDKGTRTHGSTDMGLMEGFLFTLGGQRCFRCWVIAWVRLFRDEAAIKRRRLDVHLKIIKVTPVCLP